MLRWALLLLVSGAALAGLMLGPGLVAAWQAGDRPRWWFPRRRFRRLVIADAPDLAHWERNVSRDPLGRDPFGRET